MSGWVPHAPPSLKNLTWSVQLALLTFILCDFYPEIFTLVPWFVNPHFPVRYLELISVHLLFLFSTMRMSLYLFTTLLKLSVSPSFNRCTLKGEDYSFWIIFPSCCNISLMLMSQSWYEKVDKVIGFGSRDIKNAHVSGEMAREANEINTVYRRKRFHKKIILKFTAVWSFWL